MRGMGETVAPVGTDRSTSEDEQSTSRTRLRNPKRGFFAQLQREGSHENDDIVWTLPPLFPFDCDDPNENSGFVAMARSSS